MTTRPTRPTRHLLLVALSVAIVSAAALLPSLPSSAQATDPTDSPMASTPGATEPLIISLGDSYISGEAGRWAGNTSTLATSANDALGPKAYFDNPTETAELIPRCHRSQSAEVNIRATSNDDAATSIGTLNLACSGAETGTYTDSDGYFKPGIDFYDDGKGNIGQALMLQRAATGTDVGLIVLSIGGNDFDVSGIATACVEDFLESIFTDSYCHTDPTQQAKVSATAADDVQGKIVGAIANIRTAMTNAGHTDADYTLVVQNYPQPLPNGSNFRYPETDARQSTGGCGFWNVDANWIVNDVLGVVNATVRAAVAQSPGEILTLELSPTLEQRRLCEQGVDQLQAGGITSWTDPDAVNLTEWVNEIYIDTVDSEHFQQESLHPDYWAQLALRNCLRQVWNDGAPKSGTCVRGTGLDARGEPNMSLEAPAAPVTPVSSPDRFQIAVPTATVEAPGVLDNDQGEGVLVPGAAGQADGATMLAEGADLRIVLPPDGITARLLTGPENGALVLRSDGSFTYTPTPGFTGTDTFTYVAADYYGTGAPTTVELIVIGAAAPVTATPAFTG